MKPTFGVYPMRVNELADLLEISPPVVSRRMAGLEEFTIKSSRRTVGITPEGAEDYFRSAGHSNLFNTTVLVVSSVCGGTQKTSSVVSLAAAARRITGREKAVIVIDLDSQASATETLLGAPINESEPVLVNYLEGKARLDEVLRPVGEPKENFWIIGSSLANIFLEKQISTPAQIRTVMYRLLSALIKRFGEGTRILIDTAPQLSNAVSSSLVGLALLQAENDQITVGHLLPNRGDGFSTAGNIYSLKERGEILDAFGLDKEIPTTVFLSAFDSRLKSSLDAFKRILENQILERHLSPVMIKYSSSVTRSLMAKTSVFDRKPNTAASDYMNLLLHVLGYKPRSRNQGRA